jgi:hypothetical protein
MKKKLLSLALAIAATVAVVAQSSTPPAPPSVTLAWNAPTSTPSGGNYNYLIYWGLSPTNFTWTNAAGTNLQLTISNLTLGATYYFAAQTVDTNDGASSLLTPSISDTTISIPQPPATFRIIVTTP